MNYSLHPFGTKGGGNTGQYKASAEQKICDMVMEEAIRANRAARLRQHICNHCGEEYVGLGSYCVDCRPRLSRSILPFALVLCFLWHSVCFAAPEQLGCNGATPQGPYLLADEVGTCSTNPVGCHWIVQAAWYTEILGAVFYAPGDPVAYGGSDSESGCKTALKNMMSQGIEYNIYSSSHQWLRYLPTLRAICYPVNVSVSTYMSRHGEGWQGKEASDCP